MSETQNKVQEQNKRLTTGLVVSDKTDKTVVVLVERYVKHPIYKKYIKRSKKIHAHDENNQFKVGDKVNLKTSRPHSKLKFFEVDGLVEKE